MKTESSRENLGAGKESAVFKVQNKRKKPVNIKRGIFILSFIILPVVNFLMFYVYVNANAFFMGFQETQNGITRFTLTHFSRFFREFTLETSQIREAFFNTLITFLIQQIMFPLGFLVSYFLYKKIPLSGVYRVLFFLPTIIPATVVSSFYMQFIGVDGPIAPVFQKLFNLDYTPELLASDRFANKFVLLQMFWLGFPGNLILWGGTLGRIPSSVIESAKLDGVGWFREAFSIVIPMVWPTFAMMWMLSVVGLFGASGNVFLLTQGEYGTMTLNCWMYLQVYKNQANAALSNVYNYMSAVGFMITLVSVALSFGIRKLTNKIETVDY